MTQSGRRCRSGHKAVDVNDRLRKGLRSFLRKIVTDTAGERAMVILAREFVAVRRWREMRGAIRIAFHGDGREGDRRAGEKLVLELVVLRLTLSHIDPPAVVVDHDGDVVRVA